MSEMSEAPQDSSFSKAKRRFESLRELRRDRKNLLTNLAENKSKPVPEEVAFAYNEFKEDIGKVFGREHLKRDILHHGTGAKKYEGDKYGEGITDLIQYPLDAIVSDGLEPQLDIFSMKGPMRSTSFAYSWEYAKWYATMCQDPKLPLKWEYGNRDNWGAYFLYRTLVDRKNVKHIPAIAKRFGNKAMQKLFGNKPERVQNKMHKWASAVNGELSEGARLGEILKMRTDIPGNFGGIITVRDEDAPAISWGPGDVHERRTSNTITPDKFVALSVPLDQVDSYRNVVKSLGHTFPVLPIEAVDYHMRKFPISEIIRPGRTGEKI